jgi:hypothetical protein
MDDVLALVTDVFFQARIHAAAQVAGRTVRFAAPANTTDAGDSCLILVDLTAGDEAVEAIRRLAPISTAMIVAFGPHLDTESRKAARSAGAGRVLAKSKFATELPRLLKSHVRMPAG